MPLDEFKDDVIQMGGMHRAMNFMGDIGRIMDESGFQDILVEANIFGTAVVERIMRGKSYNRGMRAHKLMNEALTRLKWSAMEMWVADRPNIITDEEKEVIAQEVNTCKAEFAEKPLTD